MAQRRRPAAKTSIERRQPADGLPEIEVRASSRRTKTATAWWEGEVLVVAVPARVKGKEREELISWLVERSKRRRPASFISDPELLERARSLVDIYDLGVDVVGIRFVTNQRRRWGSCSTGSGHIRISDRLKVTPGWVLDAVLVHELAHLAVADHSAAFHELADRHPRQREASLYLEGFQAGLDLADGHNRTTERDEDATDTAAADNEIPGPSAQERFEL